MNRRTAVAIAVLLLILSNLACSMPTRVIAVTATGAPASLQPPDVTQSPALPTKVPSPTATAIGGGRGLVAFESDRQGNQIWVMDALTGGSPRMLTTLGGSTPAWSPDGSQIVYYSIRGESVKVVVMNADGSNERVIADNAYISGKPAWSPDSSRIAYTGLNGKNLELFLVRPDGTKRTQLTDSLNDESWPAWSPDGSQLAFVSNAGQGSQVWLMDIETGGSRELTGPVFGQFAGEPAWSPDGSRIAFVCNLFTQFKYGQICSLSLTDGSFSVLTQNDMDNHAPSWSPNGDFILFYAAPYKGNWDIFQMAADGSGQQNLTGAFSSHDSFPGWQP